MNALLALKIFWTGRKAGWADGWGDGESIHLEDSEEVHG
jgi:hypothetical protein